MPKLKSSFAPNILMYIQERLVGRIFSGWIEERKYIEHLNDYRDIVEIDDNELEMKIHVKAALQTVQGALEGTKWINITGPTTEAGYRLWVLLENTPLPGHYWFHIREVLLDQKFGLRIEMKILRSVHLLDSETLEERIKRKNLQASDSPVTLKWDDISKYLSSVKDIEFGVLFLSAISCLTFHNINVVLRFTIVLIISLMAFLLLLLREVGRLAGCMLHELGIFIHNITPFLQSIVSLVEKLVGGAFILVAMIYKDVRHGGRQEIRPNGDKSISVQCPRKERAAITYRSNWKYVPQNSWIPE